PSPTWSTARSSVPRAAPTWARAARWTPGWPRVTPTRPAWSRCAACSPAARAPWTTPPDPSPVGAQGPRDRQGGDHRAFRVRHLDLDVELGPLARVQLRHHLVARGEQPGRRHDLALGQLEVADGGGGRQRHRPAELV